jgi:hypothetical protein
MARGIVKRTAIGVGTLLCSGAVVMVASPLSEAATVKAVSCTGAAALDVTPGPGSGATYSIHNGAAWCVQGVPFQGDWSVVFSGSGTATTFTCTPALGGTVSGLTLNMTLTYHNNRTGATKTVNETWTQSAPVNTWNLTPVTTQPGGNPGLIETHIFNQCPPTGTPSAYFEFQDSNAP